jgi:hypothetical protein
MGGGKVAGDEVVPVGGLSCWCGRESVQAELQGEGGMRMVCPNGHGWVATIHRSGPDEPVTVRRGQRVRMAFATAEVPVAEGVPLADLVQSETVVAMVPEEPGERVQVVAGGGGGGLTPPKVRVGDLELELWPASGDVAGVWELRFDAKAEAREELAAKAVAHVVVVRHPSGLVCRCNRVVQSDTEWAEHFAEEVIR